MALNLEAFESWRFPLLRQRYTDKDTMLYAVSIGFGQDPLSPLELPFVFEEDLKAVPTFAAILCHPGVWTSDPAFGVTRQKVVHGEQRIFVHQPLAPEAELFAHASVYGVEDKGEKGAIIHAARTMFDQTTREPVVSVLHSSFARADGGFGRNLGRAAEPNQPCPATAPDFEIDIVTRPEQALIYRLNIDRNPLHASPAYAARAGFDRPILHGLCTYGLAARALLLTIAKGDPNLIRADAPPSDHGASEFLQSRLSCRAHEPLVARHHERTGTYRLHGQCVLTIRRQHDDRHARLACGRHDGSYHLMGFG